MSDILFLFLFLVSIFVVVLSPNIGKKIGSYNRFENKDAGHMILILRGHIRNSLDNDELYHLIQRLSDFYAGNLEIFIHTWNVLQSSVSWREMDENIMNVTDSMIQTYFREYANCIRHIIIDDDSLIELPGITTGLIGTTKCPIVGWKRYLYGSYQIVKYVYDLYVDSVAINVRFDVVTNAFCHFTIDEIANYAGKFNENKEMIQYISPAKPVIGVDNIYMGRIKYMYILLKHLLFNLDEIIPKYPKLKHQEFLFFDENVKLANTKRYVGKMMASFVDRSKTVYPFGSGSASGSGSGSASGSGSDSASATTSLPNKKVVADEKHVPLSITFSMDKRAQVNMETVAHFVGYKNILRDGANTRIE